MKSVTEDVKLFYSDVSNTAACGTHPMCAAAAVVAVAVSVVLAAHDVCVATHLPGWLELSQ